MAASTAGASSAATSSATSSATGASSTTAYFAATASARLALVSASAFRRSAFAFSAELVKLVILLSTKDCLSFNHFVKRSSTCSAVNAPFFTPSRRCFFIKTPLYERIARAVLLGSAPLIIQSKARSKLRSMVAGLVLGLYWPKSSMNLPSRLARLSATTMVKMGRPLRP